MQKVFPIVCTLFLLVAASVISAEETDQPYSVVVFNSGAVMRGTVEYNDDSTKVEITRQGDDRKFSFKAKDVFRVTDEAGLEAIRAMRKQDLTAHKKLLLYGTCQFGTVIGTSYNRTHLFYNLGIVVSPKTALLLLALQEFDDQSTNFLGFGVRQALSGKRTHLYLKGMIVLETEGNSTGFDGGVGVRIGLSDGFGLDIGGGVGPYDHTAYRYSHKLSSRACPYFRIGFSFNSTKD